MLFSHLKNVNTKQLDLINYFINYPLIDVTEPFKYNENTDYATVELKQSDFEHGTVRLKKPAKYILTEDIEFSPNPENDFQPTAEQIKSGLYPVPGAYQLGFFAAITVEGPNIILDLNEKTIKQSKIHFLEQRFYANIELASAPFIVKQGPSRGIAASYSAAEKLLITNGKLGLSSHHGIHSNTNNNIILDRLHIEDFQVAGIHLNGLDTGILNKIVAKGTSKDVPILFSYSQARFLRPFLATATKTSGEKPININSMNKTVNTINKELLQSLVTTKEQVVATGKTTDPLYGNPGGLSDGNVYGIVLNVNGVVVNGFLTKRPTGDTVGNNNIYLHDIAVDDIVSDPKQTICLKDISCLHDDSSSEGYNSANHLIKGPVGDIFDISLVTRTSMFRRGSYVPNELANAQVALGLYNSTGTTYFTRPVIDWVGGIITKFGLLAQDYVSLVYGLDAMAHKMKGNIGLFISGGRNINGTNINVTNVKNLGTISSDPKYPNVMPEGNKARSIVIVASDNINLSINDTLYTNNIKVDEK